MKLSLSVLGTVIVALLSFAVAMQTRVDFSGRWTIEPEPTPSPGGGTQSGADAGRLPSGVASGDMGSGWGKTINVTQKDNRLTVEYDFFARGDMQPPLSFVYALDGSETTNSVMMGRGIQAQTSKTTWEGDKLVITTTHGFDLGDGQPAKIEVKQSLWRESPNFLVVETTRSGARGGPTLTTKTVYRKL